MAPLSIARQGMTLYGVGAPLSDMIGTAGL